MENLDYFIYYPQEDVLVVYSFEDGTLREDTFYGFEFGTESLNLDQYFWDIQWEDVDGIRRKVLLRDYSLEGFIEHYAKNDRLHALDYQQRYTLRDVCQIIYMEM